MGIRELSAPSGTVAGVGDGAFLRAARACSTNLKAISYDPFDAPNAAGTNLPDSTMKLTSIYLPDAVTLTGVRIALVTQGVYTADNNNKVGLYSSDGTTLTLRASSADDGNLWKATGGTNFNKAFSSTYNAPAGLYYVAYLYNSSAQTTAPAFIAKTTAGCAMNFGRDGNSDFRVGNYTLTALDLPATITINGNVSVSGGAGQTLPLVGLY